MKSLIICEGNTDLHLIQYYIEKTWKWELIAEKRYDDFKLPKLPKLTGNSINFKWFRKKDIEGYLCIYSAGGCTRIPNTLDTFLKFNSAQLNGDNFFNKIVILSDNDDGGTEKVFVDSISSVLTSNNTSISDIELKVWNSSEMSTFNGNVKIDLLPILIPHENHGAIEDFLINALQEKSKRDNDDAVFSAIDQCREFIDGFDGGGRFLTKRRQITKARFSTIFVVLTPEEAFAQRRDFLHNIPWEDFHEIEIAFKELAVL